MLQSGPQLAPRTEAQSPAGTISIAIASRLYWVLAAAFGVFCFIEFVFIWPDSRFYFTDYWEHVAVIRDFALNGLHPPNPIHALPAPSRYFTPYHLALGMLSRFTGLSAEAMLAAGALFISGLFLYGAWQFARTYYQDPLAPGIFLATLLCCWGHTPLIWTGFYSFTAQLHGNYYPAALGLTLSLILWAQAIRAVRGARITVRQALNMALVLACIVIVHQLAAFFAIFGFGLFVLLERADLKRKTALAGIGAAGVLLSAVWPYFDSLSLVGYGVARGEASFNNFPFFYRTDFILHQLAPALLAIPVIPLYLYRRKYLAPIAGAILCTAMFITGANLNISVTHRFLPYIALFLHMIVCGAVLDIVRGALFHGATPTRVFRAGAAAAAAVLILFHTAAAAGQIVKPWSRAWPLYPPPFENIDAQMRGVSRICAERGVSMAYGDEAQVLPAFGCRIFAYSRPIFFVPDEPERREIEQRFFRPETTLAERLAIVRSSGISYVVYRKSYDIPPKLGSELRKLGALVFDRDGWIVINVQPGFQASVPSTQPAGLPPR